MQTFMQWATAYGIPATLAVKMDWSDMVSTVKNGKDLFYWFEPLDRNCNLETTFLDVFFLRFLQFCGNLGSQVVAFFCVGEHLREAPSGDCTHQAVSQRLPGFSPTQLPTAYVHGT